MQQITQAVILAGGAGTRLQPFTFKNPKPMVPISGRPFLEYLILNLKENGIKEIIILVGFLGEKIEKYFQNGKKLGIKIKYSYTPFRDFSGEELKSGIRILSAHEMLEENFLLLYCDNYLPFNLKKLEQVYAQIKPKILLTVYSNIDKSTKNNCLVSSGGIIENYDKSRIDRKLNGVDVGFMIVNKQVLNLLPTENSKFEDVVFPKLISEKKLAGFLTDQKYYSIGDSARVKTTAKFLKPKKIILLDRDGVINKKAPKAQYIKTWQDFVFLPGVLEAIQLLTQAGYKIFVISNQAGIARNIMTIQDLELIHKKMVSEVKKTGGKIAGIYYCFHGWDEGCDCRKPKPGMLYQASREHLFDLTKALFIGDDERDLAAGNAAGCKTILVTSKKGLLRIVRSFLKNYNSSKSLPKQHLPERINSKMKIFVTGGTGFIGSSVVNELKNQGHSLLLLTRKKQTKDPNIQVILGDLKNISKWQDKLKKFEPDATFHIAWEGLPEHNYQLGELNLKYGLELIKLLTQIGCQKLIVTGSCWEYGVQKGKLSESTLPKPFDAFTAAKHALRWMGGEIAKQGNMEFIWTRPFYVYGPGQNPKSLIPYLISCIKSGKTPAVRNPNAKNDFIYVDDLADALAKLADKKITGDLYNIGSGKLTGISDIVNIIFKHYGFKESFKKGEKTYKDQLGYFFADISKIKKSTGWEPKTSIREGIKKTISFL